MHDQKTRTTDAATDPAGSRGPKRRGRLLRWLALFAFVLVVLLVVAAGIGRAMLPGLAEGWIEDRYPGIDASVDIRSIGVLGDADATIELAHATEGGSADFVRVRATSPNAIGAVTGGGDLLVVAGVAAHLTRTADGRVPLLDALRSTDDGAEDAPDASAPGGGGPSRAITITLDEIALDWLDRAANATAALRGAGSAALAREGGATVRFDGTGGARPGSDRPVEATRAITVDASIADLAAGLGSAGDLTLLIPASDGAALSWPTETGVFSLNSIDVGIARSTGPDAALELLVDARGAVDGGAAATVRSDLRVSGDPVADAEALRANPVELVRRVTGSFRAEGVPVDLAQPFLDALASDESTADARGGVGSIELVEEIGPLLEVVVERAPGSDLLTIRAGGEHAAARTAAAIDPETGVLTGRDLLVEARVRPALVALFVDPATLSIRDATRVRVDAGAWSFDPARGEALAGLDLDGGVSLERTELVLPALEVEGADGRAIDDVGGDSVTLERSTLALEWRGAGDRLVLDGAIASSLGRLTLAGPVEGGAAFLASGRITDLAPALVALFTTAESASESRAFVDRLVALAPDRAAVVEALGLGSTRVRVMVGDVDGSGSIDSGGEAVPIALDLRAGALALNGNARLGGTLDEIQLATDSIVGRVRATDALAGALLDDGADSERAFALREEVVFEATLAPLALEIGGSDAAFDATPIEIALSSDRVPLRVRRAPEDPSSSASWFDADVRALAVAARGTLATLRDDPLGTTLEAGARLTDDAGGVLAQFAASGSMNDATISATTESLSRVESLWTGAGASDGSARTIAGLLGDGLRATATMKAAPTPAGSSAPEQAPSAWTGRVEFAADRATQVFDLAARRGPDGSFAVELANVGSGRLEMPRAWLLAGRADDGVTLREESVIATLEAFTLRARSTDDGLRDVRLDTRLATGPLTIVDPAAPDRSVGVDRIGVVASIEPATSRDGDATTSDSSGESVLRASLTAARGASDVAVATLDAPLDEALSPRIDAVEAEARFDGLPVLLAEVLAGRDDLVPLLGDAIDGNATLRPIAASADDVAGGSGRRVDADLKSPESTVVVTDVRLLTDEAGATRLVVHDESTVTASLVATPALVNRVLSNAHFIFKDAKFEQPLRVRVASADVPLDDVLASGEATVRLETGAVQFSNGALTSLLLASGGSSQAERLPGLIGPLEMSLANGRLRYEKFDVKIARLGAADSGQWRHELRFAGDLDVSSDPVRALAITTSYPATALARQIRELREVPEPVLKRLSVGVTFVGTLGPTGSLEPRFELPGIEDLVNPDKPEDLIDLGLGILDGVLKKKDGGGG